MFDAAYQVGQQVGPRLLGWTFGAVRRWPVESQQGARRNAMVASTALAQRRAESEEVEEFLATSGRAPASEGPAHAAAHGSG